MNLKTYDIFESEVKIEGLVLEPEDNDVTLNIQITCRPHQAEEMKKLLFAMDMAGSLGCSRTFKCHVDGDGGFRPKVTIDDQTKKNFETDNPVDFEKSTLNFDFD